MPEVLPWSDGGALSSKNALPVRKLKATVATPTISSSIEVSVLGQVNRDATVVLWFKTTLTAPSWSVGIQVKIRILGKCYRITAPIDLEKAPLALVR